SLFILDTNDDQSKKSANPPPQSKKSKLTEIEIISQAMVFFGAGFETTASAMTNAIFELSHHPEYQERLYRELEDGLNKLDPTSDEYYDTVMGKELPYLTAVVNETLRKYPPLLRLER